MRDERILQEGENTIFLVRTWSRPTIRHDGSEETPSKRIESRSSNIIRAELMMDEEDEWL
jgi:hypothetical protein